MARKSLLISQPQIATQIVDILRTGATVVDACEKVGIAETSYHGWRKRGEVEQAARETESEAKLSKKAVARREREQPFLEFLQSTTRALADARVTAVETLKAAMLPHDEESTTVEKFTETRLDKTGKPYTYERQTVRKQKVTKAGDWRAALEYLKRRDPDNWGDELRHSGTGPGGSIPISFVTVPAPPPKGDA